MENVGRTQGYGQFGMEFADSIVGAVGRGLLLRRHRRQGTAAIDRRLCARGPGDAVLAAPVLVSRPQAAKFGERMDAVLL